MAEQVRGHVTIEKTGKWIKFQQLLAWSLLLGGVGFTAYGYSEPAAKDGITMNAAKGAAGMGFAILWLQILRVVRWWCHE
jgi:hypothetical protein